MELARQPPHQLTLRVGHGSRSGIGLVIGRGFRTLQSRGGKWTTSPGSVPPGTRVSAPATDTKRRKRETPSVSFSAQVRVAVEEFGAFFNHLGKGGKNPDSSWSWRE